MRREVVNDQRAIFESGDRLEADCCLRQELENLTERISKELKRRTRVATLFPNEASLLRLVSAVLMDISEDWESEKTYLGMTNLHSPEQD